MSKNSYKQIMEKGYMKKIRSLFITAAKNRQESQVDMKLVTKMNNPSPLDQEEIRELRSRGLEVRDGYVVNLQ